MLCVLDVGCGGDELTNSLPETEKQLKGISQFMTCFHISSFTSWHSVHTPPYLPIARELELKCWHTSCFMWHWSDECSLPKSSTLSLVWAGIQLDQLLLLWRKTHHVTGISQMWKYLGLTPVHEANRKKNMLCIRIELYQITEWLTFDWLSAGGLKKM